MKVIPVKYKIELTRAEFHSLTGVVDTDVSREVAADSELFTKLAELNLSDGHTLEHVIFQTYSRPLGFARLSLEYYEPYIVIEVELES